MGRARSPAGGDDGHLSLGKPDRLVWLERRWLDEAHAWIRERLRERGLRLTGAIEQPHVRQWSTVLRVPTSIGSLWFKANTAVLAYEAAVVDVLAGTRPDLVPELVAADRDRGWMLSGDGGERLREIVERERDLGRWLDVLPLYAELQLELARSADELVARGTPDRRLAVLPGQYEELVEGLECLSATERDGYRTLAPEVAELCRRLAAVGIPETIQRRPPRRAGLRAGRSLPLLRLG